MVEVYGSEDVLRARVDALRAAGLGDVGEVLDLAERYSAGWRPPEFSDKE